MKVDVSPEFVFQPCGAEPLEICVEVTGGEAPYYFVWENQTTDQCQNFLNPKSVPDCTVTDKNGCEITVSPSINWIAPDPIQANIASIKESSSPNSNDGRIIMNPPTGGTPPYSIVWSNGQRGLVIANLAPGSYFVTITDSENCTLQYDFLIGTTVSSKNIDLSAEAIELFPNPSKEGNSTFLKIENPNFRKGNISLTDISGKAIWEQKFQNETLIELPTNYPKGLYFISVSFENGNQKTLKLVIE